jgi:hypothetical protein
LVPFGYFDVFLTAVLPLCNKVPAELNSTFLLHPTLSHTQYLLCRQEQYLVDSNRGSTNFQSPQVAGSIVIDVLNGILKLK